MALNSIISSYNKIKEIEENDEVSPPSISFLEKRKTFSNSIKYKNDIFQIPLLINKSKSSHSLSNIKSIYDNIFSQNIFKMSSINNTNNDFEMKNININKETKINNNIILPKKNEKFTSFKMYKPNSNNLNNLNLFQNINNKNDNISFSYNSSNSEEFEEKKNINSNVYNRFRNRKIIKKNINKSNILYINKILSKEKLLINNKIYPYNEKINQIDIDQKIIKENQSPRIKKPKMITDILNNTSSFFYKNNSLYNSKTKPYIKKKIDNSKTFESLKNKQENNNIIKNNSLRRHSSQVKNIQENKKRPLILNVNLKKNIQHLKISQFKKIMNNNGITNILRFLDYYDIINIFKTKNKKIYILINEALANSYYINIKHSLLKYNNIIELLKCNIVKSQIKDSLKIDLILNIRFKKTKYKYMILNNKKEKITINFMEPLYFQFLYLYNYYQKIKPQIELLTKEELDKQNNTKKLKMYDYYSFDLYPDDFLDDYDISNNQIFLSKELPIKEKDNNNLANIQPILPFLLNDKAIINLELYTSDNGFVNPESIKIIVKENYLRNNLKILNDKNINNPRISDYEELCGHWKNIYNYDNHNSIIKMIKMTFNPFFEINNIFFENIGVYIFKVFLKAVKVGELNEKKIIGIKIKIKEKSEYIENEIRKNNLLFERRDIFELRVGDELIYYFCLKSN